mmetsp:Transcript_2876/g.7897  ORF Transcript_2876/g.7897 Transcript_2876/m.7897 type:complete len:427 (+) Transcript_2876:114-1394(+)
MPEQKQKQEQEQEHHAQKGLFPFKVKKFLSGMASAGHAALREAQGLQQPEPVCKTEHHKPPTVVLPSSKSKDLCSKKSTGTLNCKTQRKSTCSTPPTSPPVAVAISPGFTVDLTKEVIEQPVLEHFENDWEILSTDEKTSNSSGFVVPGPRVGSVRSISSLDQDTSPQTTLSVPFKIQRTNSSSTLDSQDNVLGPSGKGILGVDYVEHVCLPTDTMQGICIAYNVSASQLRRANHFSGTLHSAPEKLLIPLSKQALRTGFIRVQDTDTKEYKLHYFQAEFPNMSAVEAKVYLELADWKVKDALKSAKEDLEWEVGGDGDYDSDETKRLKAGQIGIKVGFNGSIPTFNLLGTGHSSSSQLLMKKKHKIASNGKSERFPEKERVVVHSRPPAIATKSVLAEDLYNAAPQHDSYGFELKTLSKRNKVTG